VRGVVVLNRQAVVESVGAWRRVRRSTGEASHVRIGDQFAEFRGFLGWQFLRFDCVT
jgi:hypothetical protein